MNTPDPIDTDTLLRLAARDPRPAERAADASRGLEARVLQHLPRRGSTWAEAFAGLGSWKLLGALGALTLSLVVWSIVSGAFDVMDEEWITAQLAEAPEDPAEDISLEF